MIQHYYTSGHVSPSLMNNGAPTVGLTNTAVYTLNGWLVCSFTREVSLSTQANYFDLSKQYFILAAYGSLDSSGKSKQKN